MPNVVLTALSFAGSGQIRSAYRSNGGIKNTSVRKTRIESRLKKVSETNVGKYFDEFNFKEYK